MQYYQRSTRWIGAFARWCFGNKSFVGGKCLAAIIEGDNDNEIVHAITVLTINLSTLFFDLLRSRAFYSAIAVVMGVSAFFV